MNILSVDTSTSVLYVTVKTDTKTIDFCQGNAAAQHSELLLPTIIEKCKEAGIDLKELDLLICTRGPGSFTGLRIGMSCLKGLAFGLNIPLVSVSTLLAYASMVEGFDGAVVSAIDAKKQRYYLSCYEVSDKQVKKITEEIDGNTPDIAKNLESYAKIGITGPDKEFFAQQMKEYFGNTKDITCLPDRNKSFGQVLIDLGLKQLKEKGPDDIGQGPVYIRKSDAEIALEEKQKANN